ncbi:MAG: TldD/PmbA family protein [Myxococcaceae bacterium]
MSKKELQDRIQALNPQVDFWSMRLVENTSESLVVRQGILNPPYQGFEKGVFLTVVNAGGVGYAATPDMSRVGLERAFERAREWAARAARFKLFDVKQFPNSTAHGKYKSPVKKSYTKASLKDRISWLQEAASLLKSDVRIVDWVSGFSHSTSKQYYFNKAGADIEQDFEFLEPSLSATAYANGQSQTRSIAGMATGRQAGLEFLAELDFKTIGTQISTEAIELALADNCPSGVYDLILAPDQMMLQIHESIGHPLELDRILGDERNYAGTSFVTPDMFGKYAYGSKLLNITFDSSKSGELASYAFDDEGTPAKKTYLIRNGILERPLGGLLSQARAELPGVANTRACNWNRPPIDRMANLNLEAGESTLKDMIAGVKKGVYMKSNVSWSIDDSRNKFQFGCEWGQLIENGKLTKVVRNPNYRGISATFWRNLTKVGNESTVGIYGTANCGKGEPNQAVRVGHASPVCLFSDVDVFGGAQ